MLKFIYLWIEEYKNIKNQGFNFSPRFECKYENGKLSIEEKEYQSIFPDNINITAIVGKNGAGKSGVLEFLLEIIENHDSTIFKYILISKENKDISVNTNIDLKNIENKTKYKKLLNNNPQKHLGNLHAKFITFDIKQNINLEFDNPLSYYRKASVNFTPIYNYNKFNHIYKKILLPELFYVLQNTNEIKEKFRNIFYPIEIELKIFFYRLTDEEREQFVNITTLNNLNNQELIIFLLHKSFEIQENKKTIKTQIEENIDNILNKILKYTKLEISKDRNINLLNDDTFKKMKGKTNPDIIIKLKIKIEKIDNEFFNNIRDFILILQILNLNHLEFDIKGILNNNIISFNNLSSGEKEIITITTIISSKLDYINSNIILFDETFNTLHPEWQKKLLRYLIDTFKDKKQTFHFIFTTHSSFLLSDIPKENIIFLENGKQVDVDINTFGANIHTLLTHGFFMDDGLMGEFAKSKINEAIEILNKKQLSKDEIDFCENIISKIGEPILKRQLQKMLDSKRLSKIDEIDEIKKQINELQKKMEKLENDKNRNQ